MRRKAGLSYTRVRIEKKHPVLTWSFFIGTFTFFTYIAYLGWQDQSLKLSPMSFASLHESYNLGGIEEFKTQKKQLRKNVKKNLDSPKEQVRHAAMNLAVYLFPDLLPSTNFEKDIAKENWAPQQEQIERDPHSHESRQKFEEMRANIWNYESPSRDNPELSPNARQVIRIYDALSSR